MLKIFVYNFINVSYAEFGQSSSITEEKSVDCRRFWNMSLFF